MSQAGRGAGVRFEGGRSSDEGSSGPSVVQDIVGRRISMVGDHLGAGSSIWLDTDELACELRRLDRIELFILAIF
jgi:hypothetical protein